MKPIEIAQLEDFRRFIQPVHCAFFQPARRGERSILRNLARKDRQTGLPVTIRIPFRIRAFVVQTGSHHLKTKPVAMHSRMVRSRQCSAFSASAVRKDAKQNRSTMSEANSSLGHPRSRIHSRTTILLDHCIARTCPYPFLLLISAAAVFRPALFRHQSLCRAATSLAHGKRHTFLGCEPTTTYIDKPINCANYPLAARAG